MVAWTTGFGLSIPIAIIVISTEVKIETKAALLLVLTHSYEEAPESGTPITHMR